MNLRDIAWSNTPYGREAELRCPYCRTDLYMTECPICHNESLCRCGYCVVCEEEIEEEEEKEEE